MKKGEVLVYYSTRRKQVCVTLCLTQKMIEKVFRAIADPKNKDTKVELTTLIRKQDIGWFKKLIDVAEKSAEKDNWGITLFDPVAIEAWKTWTENGEEKGNDK